MNATQTTRRSAYASKLSAFVDFVFDDIAAYAHHGAWRELFSHRIGRDFDERIIFDVGCADAGYLARIAAKHPRTAFIGLDWKYKAIHDGAAKIAADKLTNVVLLRSRAQHVRQIFADGEIDEIWVFHPEPCDREVELRNRLISEPFLIDVHAVLRDATSRLCLKTDHPGYYQWVLALFGLPEPAWFGAELESPPTNAPRLRRCDLMPQDLIPKSNQAIRERFKVAVNSSDFWNDPLALRHVTSHAFAGETTFFEGRFLRKRLPIYYFEIQRRDRK